MSDEDLERLENSALAATRFSAHRDILSEGATGIGPTILLSGWAGRVRMFADGRRQILSFLVPGDLMGICYHSRPRAATSIVALTPIALCPAPRAENQRYGTALAEAYAMSRAFEEYYLFRQIARLGRLSAYERLIDWMLEMRERLALAGLASEDCFPLPLTQEMLADALGLTGVHVNRTLQIMRRERIVELRAGRARLCDPQKLMSLIDYRPAKVTEGRLAA